MFRFLLVFILLVILAACFVKIQRRARQHRRRRALKQLAAVLCPNCRQAYGPSLRDHVSVVEYEWSPAPGHTLASLQLPAETFYVKCPHCRHEAELIAAGQLFHHPQKGILSFARTGLLRTPNSHQPACENSQPS